MNGLALVPYQLRYEQKTFWRNRASAGFTFAFPIVLFVIFGAVFNGPSSTLHGVQTIDYYTPSIMAYSVMSAGFVNLAITTTFRREQGQLKRVRGTPLPPWAYLGGLVANAVIVAVLLAVIIVGFGTIVYGANLPHQWFGLVVMLVVAAAAFCALGVAMSGFVPNADAAPAVVNLPYFVLVFISGAFFPLASSSFLAKVANFFPLRHFIDAAYASFDPQTKSAAFPWHDVLIVAAWGAFGVLVAVRRFRWEPRHT